jgi:protein gp37
VHRVEDLLRCPAAVRFVSYEPALAAVDFSEHLFRFRSCGDCPDPLPRTFGAPLHPDCCCDPELLPPAIDWIITGGESGPDRRPCEVEWFADVASQCEAAGVAFFMKQDGALRPGQQGRIPDALWSRKEFPNPATFPAR